MKSQAWESWVGCAFEIVCHKHANKIIQALGFDNIGCLVASWKYIPSKGEISQGAQIDLLLDREDNAITISEIKYSAKPFVITKSYAKNLLNKKEVFKKDTKTTKEIFISMITTVGMKQNTWSDEIVSEVV